MTRTELGRWMSRLLRGSCMLTALAAWAAEPTDSAATATSSMRQVSENQTSLGGAHFEVDLETNTLIVTTDAETNEWIRGLVAELDRPPPQVLIKVLFLELTHSDDLDIGLDAEWEDTNSSEVTGILSSIFGSTTGVTGGTAAILEHDLQVTLNALSEVVKTEVLSRPSIMARNNQEATMTIGEEVPVVTNSRVTDAGQTINTVSYEDVGIILTVTPHITPDGLVELEVKPEISSMTGETVDISENAEARVFAKRSAETHVIVPDGKTVVIGGLMSNQENEVVKKIPLLGDIWFIGSLFRKTVTEKTKTELLVFLTPHVVQTAADAVALSSREQSASSLSRRPMPASERRKYFDDEAPVGSAEEPDPKK